MKQHNMRKPLSCLALAAALMLPTFTGCSSRAPAPTQTGTAPVIQTRPAPTETTAPAVTQPRLEETLLYSEGGITVIAESLSKGLLGPEVAIRVTNGTDRNIAVSSRALSVNGYMLSASGLYCEAAAGKKALASLNLLSSDLEEAGIDTVAQVDFELCVYDTDTFEDIAQTELIRLSTSAAETHTQNIDDSGRVLFEDGGVRIISKGLREDLIWDGCLVLYLENNTDRDLTVYSENVSVNDFMVQESLYCDLRPGTRSVRGLYLLSLEELGITGLDQIQNLELSFRVVDGNFTDIAVTDPIRLDFN